MLQNSDPTASPDIIDLGQKEFTGMTVVKPAGMELRVLKEEDMDSVLELFRFFAREPLVRFKPFLFPYEFFNLS